MYVIIWVFRVAAGRRADFLRAYGPDGDWARFFQQDPEYRGIELLGAADDPDRYTTIDRWTSAAAYEAFSTRCRAQYRELDERLAPLCASETRIGVYQPVPTVSPRVT